MDKNYYPQDDELHRFVKNRYRQAWVWQTLFLSALLIAILSLSALLYNVVDGANGYVAYEFKKDPATISAKPLEELTQPELAALLQKSLSKGAYSKLDKEQKIV